MKTNFKWAILGAAAMLSSVGCGSLFPSNPSGDLVIQRVTASFPGSYTTEAMVDGADVADPMNIVLDGVTVGSDLFIQFSMPMDGTSIQAQPLFDETGAAIPQEVACAMEGTPLTLSDNWPTGTLVCYYPQAAASEDGHQLVIIPGNQLMLATGPYTISGTVRDYRQHELDIHVDFNVGDQLNLTYSGGVVYVIWPAYADLDTTYTVERTAPALTADSIDEETFTVLETGVEPTIDPDTGLFTVEYDDASVAAITGKQYWEYRVTTDNLATNYTYSTGITTGTNSAGINTIVQGDANLDGAQDLTVSWKPYIRADATTTYSLERAPDNLGIAGTYEYVAQGVAYDARSYLDTDVVVGQTYWYRVKTENIVVNGNPANFTYTTKKKVVGAVSPTLHFAEPSAGASVDVSWATFGPTVTYTVERAPDVEGAPGTWATLATEVAAVHFEDDTVAPETAYWYRVSSDNNTTPFLYTPATFTTSALPAPPP